MALSSLLLLWPLIACDGGSGSNPNKTSKAKAKAKAKADTELVVEAPIDEVVEDSVRDPTTGLTGFDRARSLTAARRHREAVTELEAMLAESAEDTRIWRLLRFAANNSGESDALLDSLDASTALGGQDVQHQMLRASLALDADRADDALDAAQKLGRADAELGAVFMARALLAGAEFDTSALDRKDPNDALVLAAVEKKGNRAKTLLKTTAPVNWQAQLLRAEIYDRIGNTDAALSDLTAVLGAEDPEASVRGGHLAARLTGDRALAANRLAEAASKAEELGLSERSCALAAEAVDAWLAEGRSDEAESFALEHQQARYDAVDDIGAAQASIAVARAGLAEGHAALALEHAVTAQATLSDNDDAWLASQAAWQAGLAAYALGLDVELQSAIEAAPEMNRDALSGMRHVLTGNMDEAYVLLQNNEIDGVDGVRIQLAGARAALAAGQDPESFTARAVELSQGDGVPVAVQIEALLEQDRFARDFGASTTALDALDRVADQLGEAGGPLAAEVLLRRVFDGQKLSAEADGSLTLPSELDAWRMALDPNAPPLEATPDDLAGMHGQARALARAARYEDAAAAYNVAWSATPSHHRGPWYPASIQTGRAGSDFWTDSDLLVEQNLPASIALLTAQDWSRSARQIDTAFAIGDDPSVGLSAEERIAYNDAHVALRGQTLRWLAGLTAEPVEARAALAEADAKALETAGFARALPAPLPDYQAIQAELKGMAILSYRFGQNRGDAVVLTADGGRAAAITDVAAIQTAAESLRAGYAAANGGPSAESLQEHGNNLRVLLVEPFRDELTGTGRYVVLPDGALWSVSFAVLPEQHASKRYLAEIRTMGYAASVGDAWRTERTQPTRYVPTYLGLSKTAPDDAIAEDGVRIPTEVENSGRHFDQELRVVHSGDAASVAAFAESARNARFIHLAGVESAERGSIVFGEETLGLAELRAMDLHARTVVVTGDAHPLIQTRWVQALRAAGCATIITTSWNTPLETRSKFIYTFYESLIQHGQPALALLQARQALREEQNLKGLGNDPAWWGPYYLHGQP